MNQPKTDQAGERTQKQIIKEASEAFSKLEFLNNHSWTNHRERLFDLCRAEEKSHRGFMSDFARSHTADTASVNDCARLFAVKRIAEYLNGEKMPQGKDYLHCQPSCFYAAGLVDEFAVEIRAAWNGFDVAQLASLDYTEVVHVRHSIAA